MTKQNSNFIAEEYYKYLKWKTKYKVVEKSFPICELCEMLHTNLPKKTYGDLNQWLADQQDCDDYNELNWFRPE